MVLKISPIYLDRLANALTAQGITLKRSKLLEVAASAFGYHNSNEFAAAAKRGDLLPPPVTPIGRLKLSDGQSLVILTDNQAGSPYAVDESFIEQSVEETRAEKIGVTPYGHLAWIGDIASCDIPALTNAITQPYAIAEKPTITIHSANVSHKHGTNSYTALSQEALDKLIADYCVEYWEEIADTGDVPEDPADLSDQDIIQIYFDSHDREFLDRGVSDLTLPEDLITSLSGALPSHAGQQRQASSDSNNPLPSVESMLQLAQRLDDGVTNDIWFDAADHKGEDAAEERINLTQNAMGHAAQILRQIAQMPADEGSTAAASLPNREIHWITDDQSVPSLNQTIAGSNWLKDVTVQFLRNAEVAGRIYNVVDILLPEGAEGEYDTAAILTALESDIQELNGRLHYQPDMKAHLISLFIPIDIVKSATSESDYVKAVTYLIARKIGTSLPDVEATFIPQAWIRDYACQADAEGRDTFSVAFELLLYGRDGWKTLTTDNYLQDSLRYAINAEKWIKDWSGPFDVECNQFEIEEFFEKIEN